MRRRLLAIAVPLCVLGTPATATAGLHSAYDFRAGSVRPSFSWLTEPPSLTRMGNPPPAADDFAAGQGYRASMFQLYSDSWSAVLLADLSWSPSQQYVRLLDVPDESGAGGLWLKDGVPTWRDSATGEHVGTGALTPGTVQLTVTRGTEALRVYAGSALVLELEEPAPLTLVSTGLTLFGSQGPEGTLRRLRLMDGELTAEEVAALRPLDVDAPVGGVDAVGSQRIHVDADGQNWVGPISQLSIGGVDDGTGPLDLVARVHGADDALLLSAPAAIIRSADGSEPQSIRSNLDAAFDFAGLTDGGEYVLRGTLSDRAGHSAPIADWRFRVDRSPPAGLTVDTPGEVDDRTPLIGGRAVVGPREHTFVGFDVCRGETCDGTHEDIVGSGGAEIVDGRWGTSELTTFPPPGPDDAPEPWPTGDLPLGTYVVRATHLDLLENVATTEKVFRVVAPPRAPSRPGPPPVIAPVIAAASPPVVATPPVTPPPPSPSALLARNRDSVAASLLREGLRGLTKDGKVVADVFADRPAEVVVQLFDGTAPSPVDPRARASASAKGRLIAAGRTTLATAGPARVTVRLGKRGRAILRGRRARRISVRTIVVPRGGAAVAATQRLTLRR